MKFLQLGFALLFICCYARGVAAQDTVKVTPPDTSVAARAFADSVRPIPQFPRHDLGPANGFTDGVWVWDGDAYMLEAPITLADLLERIPGVIKLRTGLHLQPEAVAPLGGTANRVEVWLDGYALDPLFESSFDLARLELANMESVRVERRLGRTRIHIQTLAARDSRTYSRIEAGVAQPDANLFRGIFLVPKLFFGPLSLAIDRIDTKGLRGVESADQFSGWAKWSYIRQGFGLQAEYRKMSTDRDPEAPWVAEYERDELIVRARAALGPRLVAEVFGGRSKIEVDTVSTVAEQDSIPSLDAESTQFGARASFATPLFWANGGVRFRNAEQLPSTQIDGAAGIRYGVVSAAAEITQSNWRDAGNSAELMLRAEAGPFAGFRVFGELTASDRGIPYVAGVADTTAAVITSYDGYRFGAQLEWRGITAGGALLKAKTDSVRPFGLPFDRQTRSFAGGDADGVEVSGRVPLPLIRGLYAQGSLTNWYGGNVWIWLPVRSYRAGAELHAIPLKSGNLEILGRIEAVYRGLMLVPNPVIDADPSTGDPVPDVMQLPATNTVDAYLQIRIMDVRAFIRYEDLTGQDAAQVPDRPIQGPRVFYGVKWQFFN